MFQASALLDLCTPVKQQMLSLKHYIKDYSDDHAMITNIEACHQDEKLWQSAIIGMFLAVKG